MYNNALLCMYIFKPSYKIILFSWNNCTCNNMKTANVEFNLKVYGRPYLCLYVYAQ